MFHVKHIYIVCVNMYVCNMIDCDCIWLYLIESMMEIDYIWLIVKCSALTSSIKYDELLIHNLYTAICG